jgi:hypothetical protein
MLICGQNSGKFHAQTPWNVIFRNFKAAKNIPKDLYRPLDVFGESEHKYRGFTFRCSSASAYAPLPY